jgi:hypothetical protein
MIDWTGAPPFGRQVSLKWTLELLHGKGVINPLIVEIGTSESYSPLGLGNALLAFAWYAGKFGGRVKSVDLNAGPNCRAILTQYLPEFCDLPEIVTSDAFDWAPTLHERIDLIYMDAAPELICDPLYRRFAERHRGEIPSFYVELYNQFDPGCFGPGSLLLFDDTSPETYDGKGISLIPKLLGEGWALAPLKGEPVFPMVLLEKQ